MLLAIVAMVILIGFSSHDAHASTFTAVQSGAWSDPATWGGTVPLSSDNKIIPSGITVYWNSSTVTNDLGATLNNSGTLEVAFGSYLENAGIINNLSGGILINNSYNIDNLSGGTINNNGAIVNNFLWSLTNNGTINNYGNLTNNQGTISNYHGGIINNSGFGAIILLNGYNDYWGKLFNNGIINNSGGTITTNTGWIYNNQGGIINNSGFDSIIINHNAIYNLYGGTIHNYYGGTISNFNLFTNSGIINSSSVIVVNSGHYLTNLSGGTMNNTGIMVSYPIIHMQDTVATVGLSTFSGRPIQAEYATSSSQLVGGSIDTITVQLKKVGAPTGTATIGVFNTDLSVKETIGTIDVTNISSNYKNYTFSLPTLQHSYQIQSGDRIGLKYTGGNAINYIAIMTDSTNAFDSTNSYQTYYNATWIKFPAKDMHMTLQEIDPYPPAANYMNDTTATVGLSTFSGRPIQAEYATNASQLVGDNIDTISIQLRKTGAPTGTALVGVFNTDLSVKKLFGMTNATALTGRYMNYSFKLSSELYQIQSGDRIGLKYTGGNVSNFIAVMTDNTNAFDSTNSYQTYYNATWIKFPAKDMHMTLAQTHP